MTQREKIETAEQAERALGEELNPIIGRRVVEVRGHAEHHSLDSEYGIGGIDLVFDDGTVLGLSAMWGNDGTADLSANLERPVPPTVTSGSELPPGDLPDHRAVGERPTGEQLEDLKDALPKPNVDFTD